MERSYVLGTFHARSRRRGFGLTRSPANHYLGRPEAQHVRPYRINIQPPLHPR